MLRHALELQTIGCMMHAHRLASFSSVDSVASKFRLLQLLSWGSFWLTTNSVSLLPPSEVSFLSFSLVYVYALFSVHSASDQMQSLNVNLQVVELEQHILYGMMDVGRGVTKDRRTICIHISIPFAHFIPVYVGLAQARPNYLCFLQ